MPGGMARSNAGSSSRPRPRPTAHARYDGSALPPRLPLQDMLNPVSDDDPWQAQRRGVDRNHGVAPSAVATAAAVPSESDGAAVVPGVAVPVPQPGAGGFEFEEGRVAAPAAGNSHPFTP